jgi:hypothetical protein
MARKSMKRAARRRRYFTNISTKRKVRYGRFPFAISVIDSPEDYVPFGMAVSITSTDAGLAVWRLGIQEAEVPGRFVVVDGEFVKIGDTAKRHYLRRPSPPAI